MWEFKTTARSSLRIGTDYILPASVVRDLGIYIDSNVSMRTHVTRTVSVCFTVLRQLRNIRRSVSRPVLQSLVSSLVLSRLDFSNSTLVGIPAHLLSNPWWMQLLGWFFRRRNSTTSLRFFVNSIGWRSVNGLTSNSPSLYTTAWVGTAVPHRRTLPTSWFRGSTATALGLVFITDCPPNSTLHRRRSSLPGRRCSCLEQSASARHFCSFSSRLRISAEKPLLLRFLSRTVLNVQCLWSDFVIIRHSNRSSYLLTSMCKSKGTDLYLFVEPECRSSSLCTIFSATCPLFKFLSRKESSLCE